MKVRRGSFARLVAAATFLLLTSACGGNSSADVGARQVETAGVRLSSQVLGLSVGAESVGAKLEQAQRPFVDSIGLFSFRENDLVRATLQVSRFNSQARPEEESFRRQIIGLLGGSAPQELLVEDSTVYATTGTEQAIFAWFQGRGFFVLSVHRDYEFPRSLLRTLVEQDKGL